MCRLTAPDVCWRGLLPRLPMKDSDMFRTGVWDDSNVLAGFCTVPG